MLGILGPCSSYSVYCPAISHCPPGTVQTAQPSSQFSNLVLWWSQLQLLPRASLSPHPRQVSIVTASYLHPSHTPFLYSAAYPKCSFYPFPIPSSGSTSSQKPHSFLTSPAHTKASLLHLCAYKCQFPPPPSP